MTITVDLCSEQMAVAVCSLLHHRLHQDRRDTLPFLQRRSFIKRRIARIQDELTRSAPDPVSLLNYIMEDCRGELRDLNNHCHQKLENYQRHKQLLKRLNVKQHRITLDSQHAPNLRVIVAGVDPICFYAPNLSFQYAEFVYPKLWKSANDKVQKQKDQILDELRREPGWPTLISNTSSSISTHFYLHCSG